MFEDIFEDKIIERLEQLDDHIQDARLALKALAMSVEAARNKLDGVSDTPQPAQFEAPFALH
ncbi:MAG: hypothetical protein GC131_00965 [Alphaproteobacteria bacterium]|nr:hypothetical protein [Alphaproteobacteria bacterium]